jgi:hypothetical protein
MPSARQMAVWAPIPSLRPCTTGMISTPRRIPLNTVAKTVALAQMRHCRS